MNTKDELQQTVSVVVAGVYKMPRNAAVELAGRIGYFPAL